MPWGSPHPGAPCVGDTSQPITWPTPTWSPFVCLCVSGGTSLLVDVKGYTEMEILGATRDDAAGECFDKIARVMGLGYFWRSPLDRAAQGGNDKAFSCHGCTYRTPLTCPFPV